MEPSTPFIDPSIKTPAADSNESNKGKTPGSPSKSRIPHSKTIRAKTGTSKEEEPSYKKVEKHSDILLSDQELLIDKKLSVSGKKKKAKVKKHFEKPLEDTLEKSKLINKPLERAKPVGTPQKPLARTHSERYAQEMMSGDTADLYTNINQRVVLQKTKEGLIPLKGLKNHFFTDPTLAAERLDWLSNDKVREWLLREGYGEEIKARFREELQTEGKEYKLKDIAARLTDEDIEQIRAEIESKEPDLASLPAKLLPGLLRGMAGYNLIKLILATKNLNLDVDEKVNKKFNRLGGMVEKKEGLPAFDTASKAFEELILEKNPDPDLAIMQTLFLETRTSTSNSCSAKEGESKAQKARANYDEANQYIYTVAKNWQENPQGPLLTLDVLKEINRKLLDGVAAKGTIPGELRSHDVQTGVGLYLPEEKVETRINQFLQRLNEDVLIAKKEENKYEAFKVAVRSFNELVSDHPFGDGNGRTCRLVFDLVLIANGLPPCAFDGDEGNMANFGYVEDDAQAAEINKKIEDFVINAAKALKRSANLLNELGDIRTQMKKCDELMKKWGELKATLPEPSKLNKSEQKKVDDFVDEVRSFSKPFNTAFRSSLASDLHDRGVQDYSDIYNNFMKDLRQY